MHKHKWLVSDARDFTFAECAECKAKIWKPKRSNSRGVTITDASPTIGTLSGTR